MSDQALQLSRQLAAASAMLDEAKSQRDAVFSRCELLAGELAVAKADVQAFRSVAEALQKEVEALRAATSPPAPAEGAGGLDGATDGGAPVAPLTH